MLAAYDYTVTNGIIQTATPSTKRTSATWRLVQQHGDAQHLVADLEAIRRTNNLVFADIGWAHAAYADPAGGLRAVEEGLAEDPNGERLLAGFREIDAGRCVLDTDPPHALEHLWNGNRLLLQHEQYVVVQKQFEQMHPGMKHFLSLMTCMDFDLESFRFLTWKDVVADAQHALAMGVELAEHHRTYTSFFAYMATEAGRAALNGRIERPDITAVDQRWAWADNEVLRIWRFVEATDADLPHKMQRIMQGPLLTLPR